MKNYLVLIALALTCSVSLQAQDEPIQVGEYTLTISASESELDSIEAPVFVSNCEEGNLPATYEDKMFSGGALGTIERTWILKDACDNELRTLQYIKLED